MQRCVSLCCRWLRPTWWPSIVTGSWLMRWVSRKWFMDPVLGVPSVGLIVSIILGIWMVLDPELSWRVGRREESIKSFWLLLFHIISSNNTQNLMTKDILFHFSEHLLLCTTNKNNPVKILRVLYSPVIKDGATVYKQRFQRWQRWPWKNSFGWAYIPWQVQNQYQHLSINGFLD